MSLNLIAKANDKIGTYNGKVSYILSSGTQWKTYNNFVPPLTSNTSNPPIVTSASHNFSTAWKAFAGDVDGWSAAFSGGSRPTHVYLYLGGVYKWIWKFQLTFSVSISGLFTPTLKLITNGSTFYSAVGISGTSTITYALPNPVSINNTLTFDFDATNGALLSFVGLSFISLYEII